MKYFLPAARSRLAGRPEPLLVPHWPRKLELQLAAPGGKDWVTPAQSGDLSLVQIIETLCSHWSRSSDWHLLPFAGSLWHKDRWICVDVVNIMIVISLTISTISVRLNGQSVSHLDDVIHPSIVTRSHRPEYFTTF